jgi:hypothetical protein
MLLTATVRLYVLTVSGTLTQAPVRGTSHRAATIGSTSSDHLIHIPRAPRGTTPNILRAAAAAVGVLAVVAALVLSGSASGARSEISTVGKTDAPSVRATDDFLFQLQDMDAQLVNALLVNGDQNVHVPRATSEGLYDRDRKAADGDMEKATVALAGNTAALDQLHNVSDAFGQYQAQATRTLAEDEREGGTVAGTAPAAVLADYQADHTVLFGSDGRSGLMKAATDLETASKDAIASSASQVDSSLTTVGVEFVIFGVLLAGGLGVLQVFVFRRFRRVVNPALAAATVVALVFLVGGAVSASDASANFHTAKSDAFDSVLALSEANALSAGINSDESRWLLTHDQPSLSTQFQQSFLQGENAIADVPGGNGIPAYADALKREADARTADNLDQTPMTKDSSFGAEFKNITFPTEGDKAFTAFADYNAYIQDDAKLRAMPLDTPAGLKTAIDFDTNADTPGSSDQTFNTYSSALGDVITLNESHFESAMPAAENGIGTWAWLSYVLAVLLIGLTVLGLRKRLNEYR